MKISTVVCAKNEESYIKTCLKALESQTLKPEIIVVDGHSTDKTVKIARNYANKMVFDNNKGIADARNVGWKAASGDIVAYCDADAIPPRDWIEKIAKHMDGNICIYGAIVPYKSSRLLRLNLKLWGDWFLKLSSVLRYPCICGTNMAVRKSILKKYPFRLKFLEDFDLGNRIRKIGRVKFIKGMYMPISDRRFRKSFTKTAFRYYLINYLKLKFLRDNELKSYWE